MDPDVVPVGDAEVVYPATVSDVRFEPAVLVYPKDGPLSGYCYDSDPVVAVYWLSDEIGPSVERAIARYQGA